MLSIAIAKAARGRQLLFALGLSVGLASGSTALAQSAAEGFRGISTSPSTYDPSPIRLTIGEVSFDFPKNTLFAQPDRQPRQKAILLQLVYPEMEGRTAANRAEMGKIRQDSRLVRLLIEDFSILPRPLSGKQYVNNVFSTRVTMRAGKAEISQAIDPDTGLDDFHVLASSGTENYDVFVDPKETERERSFVIQCNRQRPLGEGRISNPGCALYFPFRDLSVKASFVRRLLPQWNAIKGRVTEWMESSVAKN